jgi:hypothetical protein
VVVKVSESRPYIESPVISSMRERLSSFQSQAVGLEHERVLSIQHSGLKRDDRQHYFS